MLEYFLHGTFILISISVIFFIAKKYSYVLEKPVKPTGSLIITKSITILSILCLNLPGIQSLTVDYAKGILKLERRKQALLKLESDINTAKENKEYLITENKKLETQVYEKMGKSLRQLAIVVPEDAINTKAGGSFSMTENPMQKFINQIKKECVDKVGTCRLRINNKNYAVQPLPAFYEGDDHQIKPFERFQ